MATAATVRRSPGLTADFVSNSELGQIVTEEVVGVGRPDETMPLGLKYKAFGNFRRRIAGEVTVGDDKSVYANLLHGRGH